MIKKRSQMEIMGLAVVVILIILAMTFVVRFVILKEPSNIKKSFTHTELASNMVNTFKKSTSRDCYGLSMTELLQDCAQTLPTGSISCENGKGSCAYVNSTFAEIINKTLEAWNLGYEFRVFFEGESPIFKFGEECEGERTRETFPTPTRLYKTLNVQLDICG